MPMSDCFPCTDCLLAFCSCCDQGGACPDCGERMCETCKLDANDDERQGRCTGCYDPWLTKVEYVGQDKTYIKRHTRIRTGTMK